MCVLFIHLICSKCAYYVVLICKSSSMNWQSVSRTYQYPIASWVAWIRRRKEESCRKFCRELFWNLQNKSSYVLPKRTYTYFKTLRYAILLLPALYVRDFPLSYQTNRTSVTCVYIHQLCFERAILNDHSDLDWDQKVSPELYFPFSEAVLNLVLKIFWKLGHIKTHYK